jgi:hypothetical protein
MSRTCFLIAREHVGCQIVEFETMAVGNKSFVDMQPAENGYGHTERARCASA